MKTFLSRISNAVKFAGVVAVLVFPSLTHAQGFPVSRLYTDYGGYFTSAGTTGYTLPNNTANVIGFTYNSQAYSTGVNDAALTSNGVSFLPADFRGFTVTSMSGNAGGASSFLAYGKAFDGNAGASVYTNANVINKTTLDVLSDGIKGLNLNSGVTNVNIGTVINFPIACVNTASITDGIPDILLAQIADISSSDTYAFYNAGGTIVGNSVSVNFTNPTGAIGRWALDLFTLPTAPYNTATPIGNGDTGTTGYRDIRFAAYRLSEFGITSANAGSIVSLRTTAGGGSDPAFYAYNAGSISVTAANAGTVSANQTICSGSTATVSVSGTVGNIQWQQSTDGTTGWTSVTGGSGATTSSYTTPALTATTYYRAVVSNGTCTPVNSATVTVTVNSVSNAGTPSANTTICPNTSTAISLTGFNGTIQWQQSPDGSTGWVNVTGGSGATTALYTTASLVTTTYYRAIVTNSPCASATSAVVTVTVSSTATWIGGTSNDWNTGSNWSCNVVPDANTDAIIPVVGSGLYPALADAIGTARNLNISAGASLIVTGTGFIRIAGAINSTGTINVLDGGVNFIGSSAQQIPANVFQSNFIKNLTVNNSAGVTNNSSLSITGILNPQAGTFTTGNQVTLKSNASTTAMIAPVTGSVAGTMTIERYLPARRAFRFLTSPVDGGTIRNNWQEGGADVIGLGTDITGTSPITNGFDPSLSNNPSLFKYLNINPGSGSNWVAVPNTNATNLIAGVAYRILVRGDRSVDQTDNQAVPTNTTIRSTGTIAQGNFSRTDINQNAGGFSFIGNPYQAPLNMETVLGNLTGTLNVNRTFYYIWDPTINTRGGYVTVNVSSNTNNVQEPDGPQSSVADRFAQPGQAFFVMTEANGTAQLAFRESDKGLSTVTTHLFRTSVQDDVTMPNIRMTLYDTAALALNSPAADGFVINFDSSYSNLADAMDAKKPVNQDENAGMLIDGLAYSFQSRSMPVAADVIPLTHTQYRHTQYTYRARVSALSGTTAYLQDTYLGTQTELTNDGVTDVTFEVNEADANSIAENRFNIVFEESLGTSDSEFSNSVSVYPNPVTDGKFFVKVPAGDDYTVTLVNVLGQSFSTKNVVSGANTLQVMPEKSLASGVYMVRITNGNVSATKKLIVK